MSTLSINIALNAVRLMEGEGGGLLIVSVSTCQVHSTYLPGMLFSIKEMPLVIPP